MTADPAGEIPGKYERQLPAQTRVTARGEARVAPRGLSLLKAFVTKLDGTLFRNKFRSPSSAT